MTKSIPDFSDDEEDLPNYYQVENEYCELKHRFILHLTIEVTSWIHSEVCCQEQIDGNRIDLSVEYLS